MALLLNDEGGENSTVSLNSHRKRCYIKKQQVLDSFRFVNSEDSSLGSGAIGNSFIRVDGFVELITVEKVSEQLLDFGNTAGSSSKHDLLNLALTKLGVLERLSTGSTVPRKRSAQSSSNLARVIE